MVLDVVAKTITVWSKVSVTVVVFEMVFAVYRVDEPRPARNASKITITMIRATVPFLMLQRAPI